MSKMIPNYFKPETTKVNRKWIINQLKLNLKDFEDRGQSNSELVREFNKVYYYKNFMWYTLSNDPELMDTIKRKNKNKNIDEIKELLRKSKITYSDKWRNRIIKFREENKELKTEDRIIKTLNEIFNEILYSDRSIEDKRIMFIKKLIRAKDLLYKNNPKMRLLMTTVDIETNETLNIYTISNKFLAKLNKLLIKILKGEIVEEMPYGSDSDVMINLNYSDVRFEFDIVEKTIISNGGNFFNYVNIFPYDLSELQIFNEKQWKKPNLENCLINSLIYHKVEPEKIEELKGSIFSDYVPKRDLKKIAEIIECNIVCNIVEGTRNRKRNFKPKEPSEKTVEIVLFKDHYFPNIEIELTSYVINNFEIIEEMGPIDDWNFIINAKGKKNKKRTLKAHRAIPMLFENGFFVKNSNLCKFEQSEYVEKDDNDYLDNIENEQKPFIEGEFKSVYMDNPIFYADSETIQDGHQKAFAFGVYYEEKVETFYNITEEAIDRNQAFYDMMNWIRNEYILSPYKTIPIIYFHNLKFDLNFIEKYIKCTDTVRKGSAVWSVKAIFKGMKCEFRDSYKLISSPLNKFSEAFDLEVGKKEYMPYNLFTKHSIRNGFTTVKKYWKALKATGKYTKKDKNDFLEDCSEYINGNRFFHMNAMNDYLEMDVITLGKGFSKYRENIINLLDLDPVAYLSSASIADNYLIKEGVYDNVYCIKGNLRKYVQKSVLGGRCATRFNKKAIINRWVSDFDACSLYPSAMYRLIKEGLGFPIGKCKRMTNFDIVSLNKGCAKNREVRYNGVNLGWGKNQPMAYGIFKVKITAINKKQQIAFISYQEKNGGRTYTNEVREDYVYIDSITLKDYIEFHKIEYQIVDGVYWTKFNNKISQVIEFLYNARVEEKRKGNNITQGLYKLIMNSAYGKTLLKPSKYKYKYIDRENLKKYVGKNYNQIIEITDRNYQYRIKEYANRYSEYNRAHCGAMVLSMSKRIMNEVQNVAQDLKINIYYQDTDSLHMDFNKIELLEEEYNRRYNKELIGGQMGQFHNDLKIKNENCYSKKCIILGKKCYIDVLQSLESDKTGYHIRMKGVGSKVVEAHHDNPVELYEQLLKNEELDFDLCKGGVKFDQKNTYITRKNKFIRKIKFEGDYDVFN